MAVPVSLLHATAGVLEHGPQLGNVPILLSVALVAFGLAVFFSRYGTSPSGTGSGSGARFRRRQGSRGDASPARATSAEPVAAGSCSDAAEESFAMYHLALSSAIRRMAG
jgi:hypothetical protein